MDFQVFIDGFLTALTPQYLMWLIIGGLLGTMIGIIPGLGPATGIAVLIPMTFGMDPISALILMGSIYVGSLFGGSRASILINTPGDGSSIAATFDGYPLAKKGEAGPALAIATFASLIGGTIAVIGFIFLAEPLANLAINFGPSEYFLLLMFALAAFVFSSTGQIVKATVSVFFGLLVSTVGVDVQTGVYRYTFGVPYLVEGVNFIVVIIGVYALGEVFYNLLKVKDFNSGETKVNKLFFNKEQWKQSRGAILRGGPFGFIIGVLPGAGAVVASLMSYTLEKRISKYPQKFGKGAYEGLAGPESSNNAASIGAMIPMLSLGVPGSGATAVMLGALIMIGITPGPLLFQNSPEIVSTFISSMFIGNIFLVIINILLVGLLIKILDIPPKILYPLIVILSFIGAYSLGFNMTDIYIVILFGVIGLLFKLSDFPVAPFILAIILGADIETNLRRALNVVGNPIEIIFMSNITIVLSLFIVLSIIFPLIISIIKKVYSLKT